MVSVSCFSDIGKRKKGQPYLQSEVILRVFEADALDNGPEGALIVRVFAVFHPGTDQFA